MATGYTHDVSTGKVTDFRTFAWSCARAFGALVTMRDDPMDAPIPEEFFPSTHAMEEVEKHRKRLADLLAMTASEVVMAAAESHKNAVAAADKIEDERARSVERFEAMLASVMRWKPPTPEHSGLRDFMAEQLRQSIKWESHKYDPPVERTPHQWISEEIERTESSIAYYEKSHREELERTANRNAWIKALRESLDSTLVVAASN